MKNIANEIENTRREKTKAECVRDAKKKRDWVKWR